MADINLKARISLQDDASRSISSIKKKLSELLSVEGAAEIALGTFAGYGLAGAAFGAVGLSKDLARAVWELGEASSQSLRAEMSFNRLAEAAGSSGQAILKAMKEASRGTIDDTSLIMAANRAMVLGVADSAEELGALVEAAIIRGRDMGISARQAVDDLVTGIGRMSPQILDNLGITNASRSIEEYAKSLGKASNQLTDVEKKAALLKAVLESTEGVEIIDDAASSFERMEASIANAQDALGRLFSPAISGSADFLANTLNELMNPESTQLWARGIQFSVEAIKNDFRYKADTIQGIFDIFRGIGHQFNLTFNLAALSSEQLNEEIASLQQRLESMKAVQSGQVLQGYPQAAQVSQVAIDQLTERIEILQRALYAKNASIHDSIYGVQMLAGAMKSAENDVNSLTGAVLNLDESLKNMSPVLGNLQNIRRGMIGRAESLAMQAVELGADPQQVASLLGETSDAIWNMGLSFDASTEAQFLNRVATEKQLEGLESLVNELSDAQRAAQSFAQKGISEVNRELSQMERNISGLVSSQISEALSLEGISWEGRGSKDGNRINENARRLAAIANEGLIGQDWLGKFAEEAPQTYADLMLKIAEGMRPQEAAQYLLEEFQLGLRPDLIDFEMIKQRVKDQLTSQQAIEEMTRDLTSQLMSEMGVTAEEVQGALGALGFGRSGPIAEGDFSQGESSGKAFSNAFINGFAAADVSLKIVMGIGEGIKKNEGLIAASGRSVGTVFGDNLVEAFSNSTPSRLIDVLTVLVTPQVWAQIQSLQSRTEPS